MFLGYACNRLGIDFNLQVGVGTLDSVKHVNDWCFRGGYNVDLWEDDLNASALYAVHTG